MRDALHVHGTSVAAAALPSLLRPLSLPPALAVHMKEDVFWQASPHADPARGGIFKKKILSVRHMLLECPITTELFQRNRYDINACNNIRDILYNTDIINSIVKLIVHSPMGKPALKKKKNSCVCVCMCFCGCFVCLFFHLISP